MLSDDSLAGGLADLRVLEIGHQHFSKSCLPGQTTLVWTFPKPDNPPVPGTPLTFRSFAKLLGTIRAGAYDLIIVYVDQWPPWHWKQLRRIVGRRPAETMMKL